MRHCKSIMVQSGAAAVLFGLLMWSKCSSDETTSPTDGDNPIAATGNVSKGPVVGAANNIYRINSNGTIGDWKGDIPGGETGPLVMIATGGSYTDEATGSTVNLASGQEMYGTLQGTSSQVTPSCTPPCNILLVHVQCTVHLSVNIGLRPDSNDIDRSRCRTSRI